MHGRPLNYPIFRKKKVFELICSRTEFLIECTQENHLFGISIFYEISHHIGVAQKNARKHANIYTDMYTNYINYKSLRQITIDCFAYVSILTDDDDDDDESKKNPKHIVPAHPIRFDFI